MKTTSSYGVKIVCDMREWSTQGGKRHGGVRGVFSHSRCKVVLGAKHLLCASAKSVM